MVTNTALNAPIFIGGSGRSGTTLVVDMLGLHPDLSPVYETSFVVPLAAMLLSDQGPSDMDALERMVWDHMEAWAKPLPHRPHNKGDHERYFHGPHYILFSRDFVMDNVQFMLRMVRQGNRLEAFRNFVLTLFNHHAQLDTKPRWINKHPGYVKVVGFLKAVFPDMKFIHCVRDGRDVAVSVMGRDWGPNEFAEAAPWWLDALKPGLDFEQQYPDHCLTLSYEVLVQHTAAVLPQVFKWMGVADHTADIVDRYGKENGPSLATIHSGKWKGKIPEDEVLAFEKVAGPMLERLGYVRSTGT